jgi:FAD/FMN-containing dehydrogenase
MEIVYAGDPAQGEKELAPLLNIGNPVDPGVKVQDYTVMQTQEDAAFGHGIRSYAKSGMVREITHELLDTILEANPRDPRAAFFVHTAGGAVKRVGELDTAWPHRNAETMLVLAGGWMEAVDDEPGIRAIRDWYAAVEPHTGGYYDNIDFDGAAAAGNYGPAYPRLQKIKGQFDPGNLFRLNSNIEPAV